MPRAGFLRRFDLDILDDKLILFASTPFSAHHDWTPGVPEHSRPVTVFSLDDRGRPYQLPFKCVYKRGEWFGWTTKSKIGVKIEGFR